MYTAGNKDDEQWNSHNEWQVVSVIDGCQVTGRTSTLGTGSRPAGPGLRGTWPSSDLDSIILY